jgi:hypothetical protein
LQEVKPGHLPNGKTGADASLPRRNPMKAEAGAGGNHAKYAKTPAACCFDANFANFREPARIWFKFLNSR